MSGTPTSTYVVSYYGTKATQGRHRVFDTLDDATAYMEAVIDKRSFRRIELFAALRLKKRSIERA